MLNQKGGVGKTGLTVGTGGALAERGRRVLLVDLDPQGHLTAEALRMEEADPDQPNLASALVGEHTGPIEELIHQREPHPSGGQLDIIPTSVAMFLVVRQLYHGRAPSSDWRVSWSASQPTPTITCSSTARRRWTSSPTMRWSQPTAS
ncbi:ParA family protein [Amycolatopsis benzoatilytica]|uniref:ParA family protein n=1 Tax=Amycolatopsis benzoatilytica TaxID=346045 RepID=UPI00247FF50C|nr:AAA family ATPase [Amycolatopsis benzoatilytica]